MKQQNKIAVFIPIKDHSERIKRKNFFLINNQPLHSILINKLLFCKTINHIYINTDSTEIEKYYKFKQQITVIKRDKSLIGNNISMNKIIDSSLDSIKEDIILQTHITNPLVRNETFEKSCKQYFASLKNKFDSLVSVNQLYKRFYNKNFEPINHNPKILLKTQDLDPLLVENSCIYIFSKLSFIKNKSRIGKKPFLFKMNEYESIDIDWPEDLEVIEKLINQV